MSKGKVVSVSSKKRLPMCGYENKCEEILLEMEKMPHATFVLSDEGYKSLKDYARKIPYPIAINLIRDKLAASINRHNSNSSSSTGKKVKSGGKHYTYLDEFSRDVRRIFGNFNRYNYLSNQKSLRTDLNKILFRFEQLWHKFMQDIASSGFSSALYSYPLPLPELEVCLNGLEKAYPIPMQLDSKKKKSDPLEHKAIDAFIDNIDNYFQDKNLKNYLKIVKKPISFGEIISKLIEGEYAEANNVENSNESSTTSSNTCGSPGYQKFEDDIDLLVDNCTKYWSEQSNTEHSKIYIASVMKLQETIVKDCRMQLTSGAQLLPTNIDDSTASATVSVNADRGSTAISTKGSGGDKEKADGKSSLMFSLGKKTLKAEHVVVSKNSSNTNDSTGAAPIQSINSTNPAAVQKRKEKFLNEAIKQLFNLLKDHYILNANGVKIVTSLPFLRVVDSMKYPDYNEIVQNPIYILKMEKNLTGGKYANIGDVIFDMELLKNNVYIYNTGVDGIEIRIMVDSLLEYFNFLLSLFVYGLHNTMATKDPLLVEAVVNTQELTGLVNKGKQYLLYVRGDCSNAAKKKLGLPDHIWNYLEHSQQDPTSLLKKANLPYVTINSNTIAAAAKPVPQLSISLAKVLPSKEMKGSKSSAKLSLHDVDDDDSVQTDGLNTSRSMAQLVDTPMTATSSSDYGNKKKVVGNKRFLKGAQSVAPPLPPAAIEADWEFAADKILKSVKKHPYVDFSKATCIANFMYPVVDLSPGIAEVYLSIIEKPSDLGTITSDLNHHAIPEPIDFYEQLVSVFQNAKDYNSINIDHETEAKIVKCCDVLISYVNWLCLEHLPVVTDIDGNTGKIKKNAESFGYLRLSTRNNERIKREDILKEVQIQRVNNPYTECNKLLKELTSTKNKKEEQRMGDFHIPIATHAIADYLVHVEEPIDLSTVKFKLDGTLPVNQKMFNGDNFTDLAELINKKVVKYTTYYEFLTDLRLVFKNSIAYNGAHVLTDPTDTSKMFCEYATLFLNKLEELIPKYTINLVNNCYVSKLAEEESLKARQMRIQKQQEDKELEEQIYQKKLLERQAESVQDRKLSGESNTDAINFSQVRARLNIRPGDVLTKAELAMLEERNVFGFGANAKIAPYFLPYIDTKIRMLVQAKRIWSGSVTGSVFIKHIAGISNQKKGPERRSIDSSNKILAVNLSKDNSTTIDSRTISKIDKVGEAKSKANHEMNMAREKEAVIVDQEIVPHHMIIADNESIAENECGDVNESRASVDSIMVIPSDGEGHTTADETLNRNEVSVNSSVSKRKIIIPFNSKPKRAKVRHSLQIKNWVGSDSD